MCIFESDTVKSDCPMQENYVIFKKINTDCWFTLLVLLFVLALFFRPGFQGWPYDPVHTGFN